MDKFCTFCGKEKLKVPSGKFSAETGEPVFKTVCENACAHNLHDFEAVHTKGFGGSWGWPGNVFSRCKKCGIEDHSD